MTAPVLSKKKFYIIKPAAGTNQIKNPRFDTPDGVEDWTASGAGVTIALTGSEQRFGAYCMQVNTATGVASGAMYDNVTTTVGADYTFSCYVKGTAGQAMRIYIADSSHAAKATTTWTASGYWERKQVTYTGTENKSDYELYVIRDSVASTAAFYVDGVQFEQASAASTLMHGHAPGCRWSGLARNSSTIRSVETASGGQIIDLESYCHVVQAVGLGHGDWNQTLTKMTSGGDMYQDYTRKSRQFSLIVDFLGTSLGEIETNRKAVIDLIRPDQFEGQEMVVRYQGVDVNGVEATHPIDIRCVPLPATLVDTPDLPTYQRAVLNFAIPSGLLDGAYNEGAELDLYANFPAEFIVKRDKDGNWCSGPSTDGSYSSLVDAATTDLTAYDLVEMPNNIIYTSAFGEFVAQQNGETWANVPYSYISSDGTWIKTYNTMTVGPVPMADFPFGGANTIATVGLGNNCYFSEAVYLGMASSTSAPDTTVHCLVKNTLYTDALTLVPDAIAFDSYTLNDNNQRYWSAIQSPTSYIYLGGDFAKINNVSASNIAYWDGAAWHAIGAGLNGAVLALAFAPNGDLYIGGAFTNATTDGYGDYLCYKRPDENVFKRVGMSELNGNVYALAFDGQGRLYVGGAFTTIGSSNISYIARWNGNSWEALGSGVNGIVRGINIIYDGGPASPESAYSVYVTGDFTTAGGLTLTDRIAVWRNGAWQALDIDLPGSASVNQVLKASDGSLYIGGAFSSASSSDNAKTGIVAVNVEVSSASANTYPYMQIRGPGTLKQIANYTTGKSIQFDGLTLQAGEWINLSFNPLNLKFTGGWPGRGNLMRYVVPGSDYGNFYMKPGSNSVSLFMTGTTTDSGAFMFWTPKFWGVDGALL